MDESTPSGDRALDFIEAGSEFPPAETARDDGLVAIGGDLSVKRLLDAYRNGIFPWFEAGEPILWWSPDPRLVLEPPALHVSRSLRALLRKGTYSTTFDTAFRRVIQACAVTPRKGDTGTWITPEIEAGYTALHELGYAHSVETWRGDELVGGLYGVLLGRCFFGESMFSRRADASKVALVGLAEALKCRDVHLIDCQVASAHMISLGATLIPREAFLRRLRAALHFPDLRESWSKGSNEAKV
jgi:leucyl/phenylalanyl-tRNA--protein transferase